MELSLRRVLIFVFLYDMAFADAIRTVISQPIASNSAMTMDLKS
jgi:hypothetical protein